MTPEEKQSFICEIARQNRLDPEKSRILWSRHGIEELIHEDWARIEVEEALQDCIVIEDYPTLHRLLPDCLVLGRLTSGEPLHVVVAVDANNNRLFIVTIYEPSNEEWEDDWKTRKK
jgi:hypothetical protein